MIALLLALVAPADATPPRAVADEITRPVWAAQPSPYYVVASRPPGLENRPGGATVECTANTEGALRGCRTLEEMPGDAGLGPAAIVLVEERYRLAAMDGDGRPVAGRPVRVRIGWLEGSSLTIDGAQAKLDWNRRPAPEEMARLFPVAAQAANVGGSALVACGIATDGWVKDCAVVDETPGGYGFGEASKRLAALFQHRPMSKDGRPVAGGTVRIRISWFLPD